MIKVIKVLYGAISFYLLQSVKKTFENRSIFDTVVVKSDGLFFVSIGIEARRVVYRTIVAIARPMPSSVATCYDIISYIGKYRFGSSGCYRAWVCAIGTRFSRCNYAEEIR